MNILLTNDDGIESPLLYQLTQTLCQKHTLTVIVPALDQSGMGQAFTYKKPLQVRESSQFPVSCFVVEGTPADCIKFAISELCEEKEPDLILSGINVGENAGVSTCYSGTVAAAREGALWGLQSAAVSIAHPSSDEHFRFALHWLLRALENWEHFTLPPGGFWNINFPNGNLAEIAAAEVTTMSTVMFRDEYQKETDNSGKERFWLRGYKPKEEFQTGSDDDALARNCIAMTPLRVQQDFAFQIHNRSEIARQGSSFLSQ